MIHQTSTMTKSPTSTMIMIKEVGLSVRKASLEEGVHDPSLTWPALYDTHETIVELIGWVSEWASVKEDHGWGKK